MHSRLDHETQVTTIPGHGRTPLDQFYYQVPEGELNKFAKLIKAGTTQLPDPWQLTTPEQINSFAIELTEIFTTAIKTTGKPNHGESNPAPW
jgi:hypothetical protein